MKLMFAARAPALCGGLGLLAFLAPAQFVRAADDTGRTIELTATLQGDYVQDFNRVEGNWDDTLRPSKIPTTDGEFGDDGQAIISARQSGIGISGSGHGLRGVLNFDMYGQGSNEGETTFHLKDAYGQWGPWVAGQLYTVFMDADIFPNVIDYWGPSGMVYVRNPQLRWMPVDDDHYNMAVAIEKPSDDVDPGQIDRSIPTSETTSRAAKKYLTSPRTSG